MVTKLAMAALLAAVALPTPASVQASGCSEVGGTLSAHFTGRLSRPIFPGPPGYEDVRRGDTAEPAYILSLDAPACVHAAGDADLDHRAVSRIHLRLDPRHPASRSAYDRLGALIGRRITVTGTDGFAAQTGHHRAPLRAHRH